MRKYYLAWAIIAAYYVGFLYRIPMLFVLGSVGLLVAIGLLLQAQFMWNGLEVAFRHKVFEIQHQTKNYIPVRVERKGKLLPINGGAIKIRLGYKQEAKRRARKIFCGICKWGDLEFTAGVPYCGVVMLNIEKFWVHDVLGFYLAGRKVSDSMQLYVLPRDTALNIGKEDAVLTDDKDEEPPVHWNQTDGTDYVCIKEYELTWDSIACIQLDLTGLQELNQKELGNFYLLLSALVMGLLKCVRKVRVNWYDEWRECYFSMEAADLEQCRELLKELYRTGLPGAEMSTNAQFHEEPLEGQYFRLDLQLGWYLNDQLIYRFDEDELSDEMKKKSFVI